MERSAWGEGHVRCHEAVLQSSHWALLVRAEPQGTRLRMLRGELAEVCREGRRKTAGNRLGSVCLCVVSVCISRCICENMHVCLRVQMCLKLCVHECVCLCSKEIEKKTVAAPSRSNWSFNEPPKLLLLSLLGLL